MAIVPFLVLDVSAQAKTLAPPADFPVNTTFQVTSIFSTNGTYDSINATIQNRYGGAAGVSGDDLSTGYFHTSGVRYVGPDSIRMGDIFIPSQTRILPNTILEGFVQCTIAIGVADQLAENNHVPGITVPDNTRPQNNSTNRAMGFDIYLNSNKDHACSPDLEAASSESLLTDKELRVTIYDKHDKEPYYFSPRDNIVKAQSIAECSDTNFNATDQTLKGDSKMCYGKNGTNMVILTKRLTGFYGAADSVIAAIDPSTYTSRENIKGVGGILLFNITTTAAGTATIDASGKYSYSNPNTTQNGHIYIPPNTRISNDLFVADDANKVCVTGVVVTNLYHSDFARPTDVSSGTTYGFGYSPGTDAASCTLAYTDMTAPLDIDNILQVVLYDQAGKEGYSYHPGSNIMTAQDIVACSSTNFNNTTKTLLGDTKQCYADVGDDLVIYTKVMQMYGAKSTGDTGSNVSPTSRQDVYGINTHTGFNIKTTAAGSADILNDGKYTFSYAAGPPHTGHIYIPPDTKISNDLFVAGDASKTCIIGLVLHSEFVNDLAKLPSGVNSTAYGFGYSPGTDAASCTLAYNDIQVPLNVDNTLQVVLYDQAGSTGYWYHRASNINNTQNIVACSSTNFDSTAKTLKGTTKYCYADVGSDLVVYTKVMQWYGAKASDTGNTGNTGGTGSTGTSAYIELLKRLYLPPI